MIELAVVTKLIWTQPKWMRRELTKCVFNRPTERRINMRTEDIKPRSSKGMVKKFYECRDTIREVVAD